MAGFALFTTGCGAVDHARAGHSVLSVRRIPILELLLLLLSSETVLRRAHVLRIQLYSGRRMVLLLVVKARLSLRLASIALFDDGVLSVSTTSRYLLRLLKRSSS